MEKTLNFLTGSAFRKRSVEKNTDNLTFRQEIEEFNKSKIDYRNDWMKPAKETNLSNLLVLVNDKGAILCYLSQTKRHPKVIIIEKDGIFKSSPDLDGKSLSLQIR